MLSVIHFSDSITLGSIIVGLLIGIGGLATFLYGVRWKTAFDNCKAALEVATETINVSNEGREAFRLQSERFRNEAQEQRELKHRALNELAAANLKTDLTGLLKQFQEQHIELMNEIQTGREGSTLAIVQQLLTQEERHIGRHEQVLSALETAAAAITSMSERTVIREETP